MYFFETSRVSECFFDRFEKHACQFFDSTKKESRKQCVKLVILFFSPPCVFQFTKHCYLSESSMEDGTGCAEGEENQWHGNIGMQFHVGYFARSVTLIYKQYACDPYVFTLLGWLTHSRGKKKKFAIFVKQQYIPVSVFHACCILTNKSIIELSLTNKLAQISRRDLSNKFQLRIFVKNQKSITRKLLVTQERSLLNFNINQF